MQSMPSPSLSLIVLLTLGPVCGFAQELSPEISVFSSDRQEPLFAGRAGYWDARIRERGWIMKDGDLWRMWYTGYDPDQEPVIMRLGYATSADGLTWERFGDGPLIDDLWVEDMMVIRQGERWLMFAEGRNDQAHWLSSTDGIHWQQEGTLDIRLQNGQPIPPGPFGTPTVFFEDGVWNLFYERRDAGIWLARSTDLRVWTNVDDEPVILPGPEPWDSLMIALNQVILVGNQYVAVLHGTGTPQKPRVWCTTLAISDDLRNWKKFSGNPILPVEENRSSGLLIHDGQRWRLYTMHDEVKIHWGSVSR